MLAARTHRRLVPLLVASFASLLLLAGCVGQRDPDSWNDSTKKAFVAGCDGRAAEEEPIEEIRGDLEAVALPTETCECIVDHLEENMEFSEFKAANSKRRDETNGRSPLVGDGFDDAYAACVPDWVSPDGAGPSDGDSADEPSTEEPATDDGS